MQVIATRCLKHQAIRTIKCYQRCPANHPASQRAQATRIGFAVDLVVQEFRHTGPGIGEAQARTDAVFQGRAIGGGNDKTGLSAFRQGERRRVNRSGGCRTHRAPRRVEALAAQPVQRPVREPQ